MASIISTVLAVLFLLYIFAIFPALRRHPDRVLMKGMYVAHRGIHQNDAGIPENSILSFLTAKKLGFCIETDIRITSDGQVVVFHDDDLLRLCGVSGKIEDHTLAELKEMRLLQTDCRIPTLSEVLQLVEGEVPLLIELKCDYKSQKRLCAAADTILRSYHGKYMVQSYYPPALLWFRRHHKEICRGQLALNFAKHHDENRTLISVLAGWLLFNFLSRPDFIAYDERDTDTFARNICTVFGALPVGWVFRSEQRLTALHSVYQTYVFEHILPEKPYDDL